MRGSQPVVDTLNHALGNKLITINQYFLHAKMLQNWGFPGFAKTLFGFSINDMKHADRLIERLLFLEARPLISDLGYLHIGENPEEIVRSALTHSKGHLKSLSDSIAVCEKYSNYVSRDLLATILHDTESQTDWLETQISLLDTLGLQKFLQSHLD